MMTSLCQRSLPVFSLLFCASALAACNLVTAPSETAGSHASEDGQNMVVRVRYHTDASATAAPATVDLTTIGNFSVVTRGEVQYISVPNLQRNSSVNFFVQSQGGRTASQTCTWGGVKGVFSYDTSIEITDHGPVNGIRIECDRGW
jgi:hypothetical protein